MASLRSSRSWVGTTSRVCAWGWGPVRAGEDLSDWVLEDFEEDEWEPLKALLERSADAFEHWVHEGSEKTMGRFNG